MKEKLLAALINVVIEYLTPERVAQFVHMILDFVETEIHESDSKIDDMLILPVCDQLRQAFPRD